MDVRPVTSRGINFQSQAYEAGGEKTGPSPSSGSSLGSYAPVKENEGSCFGSVLSCVLYVPKQLLEVVQAFISLITCRMCCNAAPNKEALYNAVKEVKDASTRDEFLKNYPAERESIISSFVEATKVAQLGKDIYDPLKRKDWVRKFEQSVREEARKKFDAADPDFFAQYAVRLKEQMDAPKSDV